MTSLLKSLDFNDFTSKIEDLFLAREHRALYALLRSVSHQYLKNTLCYFASEGRSKRLEVYHILHAFYSQYCKPNRVNPKHIVYFTLPLIHKLQEKVNLSRILNDSAVKSNIPIAAKKFQIHVSYKYFPPPYTHTHAKRKKHWINTTNSHGQHGHFGCARMQIWIQMKIASWIASTGFCYLMVILAKKGNPRCKLTGNSPMWVWQLFSVVDDPISCMLVVHFKQGNLIFWLPGSFRCRGPIIWWWPEKILVSARVISNAVRLCAYD